MTHDEDQLTELTIVVSKEPIGISNLLPPFARDTLVAAALEARLHPENSFQRRLIIEKAIVYVQRNWPEYFRHCV